MITLLNGGHIVAGKNSPAAQPSEVAPELADENAQLIGQRVRTLRGERKLTIAELAAKASVSAGLISQIERGSANPSIKTLQRLCDALDVNVWRFLDDEKRSAAGDAPPFIRRQAQRPRMVVGDKGLTKELLSPQYADELRFMFVTMPPGSATEEMLIGAGQKAGYVMAGTVELTVGEHTVLLEEGDSFQFSSDVEHGLANRSDRDARVLWIISALDVRL